MSAKKFPNEPGFTLSTPVRLGATAVAACFLALPALGNPTNPTVVNGSATFQQVGNVLNVTNSNGAIINWNTFSIGAGETTRFIQASASSSVLNRVLSNDPSRIYGTLTSNGRVWLVNPAGIFVGPSGVIDAAGFVASTLNISNENFLAGRKLFDATAGAGSVINQGTITTPSGGSIYLIAPNVSNEGIIRSPNGEVILAAGQTVNLIDSATPGVKVEITGAQGNATNLGEIMAEAGRIGMAGVLVRNSGTLNASSVVSDGGRIFLKATGDTLVEGGRLNASSTVAKGGRIDVLGDRVAVAGSTEIDASGATGGGYVRVGGDYQGGNPEVQNARMAYFGQDAVIKVDATDSGDGGTAIIWANGATRAYGHIYARGGTNGGNGGFVENSGHDYLDFQGRVDTSAAHGRVGKLLLDPSDIIIDNSTDNLAGGSFSGGWFSGATTNATLTWTTINAQSGSLEIRTNSAGSGGNGDILINGSGSVTGPSTLTLLANRNIDFGSGVTVSAGNHDVNLISGWNNTGWAVMPGTGVITFTGGSSLNSTTGNVYMYSGNGLLVQSGASLNVGGTLDIGTLANPMLGNVVINGSVLSSGTAQNVYTSGTVTVQANDSGFASLAYTGTGLQTVHGAGITVSSVATASNSRAATISSSGDQDLATSGGGNILVQASSPAISPYGDNYASINATGNQTFDTGSGSIQVLAGVGGTGNNRALITAGGHQMITNAGSLVVKGDQNTTYGASGNFARMQSGGYQDFTLTGGITIWGGNIGSSNSALVSAVGTQTIMAGGIIDIKGGDGGSGNYAELSGFSQHIHAAGLMVRGGNTAAANANYAYVASSNTSQDFTLGANGLLIVGGSGSGDWAHVTAQTTQDISSVGSVTITGGNGAAGGNDAGLTTFGSQTLTGGPAVVITGGTVGNNNSAYIVTSFGDQTFDLGALTLTAGVSGNNNQAMIEAGHSQAFTLAGNLLMSGGGAVSNGYNDFASIRSGIYAPAASNAGQTFTFTGSTGVVQLTGSSSTGVGGSGPNNCGAACNPYSTTAGAWINNKGALQQKFEFHGTGPNSIVLNAGSGGSGNDASIDSAGPLWIGQSGAGARPGIQLNGGASGGKAINYLGTNYYIDNSAGLSSDTTTTIYANTLNMSGGTATFGGAYIGGQSVNINVTGALFMAAAGSSPANALGTDGSTLTGFVRQAPAAIGEMVSSNITLDVGSLNLVGTGTGLTAFGGSPIMIGSLNGTGTVHITSHGTTTVNALANANGSTVFVGSRLGMGGSIQIDSQSTLSLDQAYLGVGMGAGDSINITTGNAAFSQTSGGKMLAHDVSIDTGTGSVTQPVGAVVAAANLTAHGDNLSFSGDNLVTNVTLNAITGASYNSGSDVHIVSATAPSGNITVTSVPTAYVALGSLIASGTVDITAGRQILDDNGSALNITAGTVNLTSQNGPSGGGLAISADTAATTALSATVNVGATNGGIYVRNFTVSAPGAMSLHDFSSSSPSVSFYQDSALDLVGKTFKASGGHIVIGSAGSMTGIGTASFPSGYEPNQLILISDANMSLAPGGLLLPSTSMGLSAAGTLDIGYDLSSNNLALNAGVLNIFPPSGVFAGGDLVVAAGTMNVTGYIDAQNVAMAAGTLDIGPNGAIHASNHFLGAVAGNATLTGGGTGGYINTGGGDLELIVGGNLALDNGAYIWAGSGVSSSPYADTSIAVRGNLSLSNGSYISADNDIYLDMLGANSRISMTGSSYVLSDVVTGVAATTHVTFAARNDRRGIVIDGIEDEASTVVGGSGFFAVDMFSPATDKASGLDVVYPSAANTVDPCVLNPVLCLFKSANEKPGDQPGPKLDDPKKDKDDKDKDKDKDKFGEEGEGKKDEKPAQRKVAQCT